MAGSRKIACRDKNRDKNKKRDTGMLRTITVGTCVQVQGVFERQLENGKILVRVGERLYEGTPVEKKAA